MESNGVQIACRQTGKADTTLLFVHGWCIDKEYWEQQVSFFSPRYKVVTMDLPGFGQSGKNRASWNFADYTTDVISVIDKLKLKNVVLIGHSMSGDILLDISSQYPARVAGIVGIDNLHEPAGAMDEQGKKDAEAFFTVFRNRYDSVVKATVGQYLFQPSTDTLVKNRVMGSILQTDPAIAVPVIRSLTFFAQEEKARMQKLNHKLYLVNSDVMPVKMDSLNKYCAKGAEVFYVKNTGHYPMLEKPAEFNAALQQVIFRIAR